jgi:protein gp37
MGEKTAIAWTDHTFNPVLGCAKISEGCRNCYAEAQAKRYGWNVWGDSPRRITSDGNWKIPIRWNLTAEEGRPHRVFCGSMCDIFEDHPTVTEARERLWSLIRQTPCLHWQLLTKRVERIKDSLPEDWGAGYPNVWIGTTIESNDYKQRADYLREVPAMVRFISYEPAIGPLQVDLAGIQWLIYGGESGAHRRGDNTDWARAMRTECQRTGTAFFFKQSSGLHPGEGIELDGAIVREFPMERA